jgi:DnaJ family protein C protein 28
MNRAEEQIRQAMQEGKFDNLQGKGKPLNLKDDPFEDPEWRMAYHVLQGSGYTLPWIETRRSLEADIQAARAALKRTWDWREVALSENQPADFVIAVWGQAVETFRRRASEINQRILSYNLEAPLDRFHLSRLDAEGEITLTATPASDRL